MKKHFISTIEELKATEEVMTDSSHYKPIFTSNVVESFQQQGINLLGGYVIKTNSRNFCQLNLSNNIIILNSFDKSTSFRLYFNCGSFMFGNLRLVHRGFNAEDFNTNSQFFIDAMVRFEKFYKMAQQVEVSDEAITKMMEIVSYERSKDVKIQFQDRTCINVLNHIIDTLKSGSYEYYDKKGVLKKGRKVGQLSSLLAIQKKISILIEDEFPELFL